MSGEKAGKGGGGRKRVSEWGKRGGVSEDREGELGREGVSG